MDFEIYCDESRQEYFHNCTGDGEHHVLIGGLWIEANRRQDYKNKIRQLRSTHDVWGEFKWNRVSPYLTFNGRKEWIGSRLCWPIRL